jgi:hypothetical protein
MLHGDIRVLLQNTPGRGSVNVIKEDDGGDFAGVLGIEVFEGGRQLIGIRILTIDQNNELLTALYELVNVALYVASNVRDLANLLKIVIVPLVKECGELFIVVEDIALIRGIPVDVDLIGVKGEIAVIEFRCSLGAFLSKAIGHDEDFLDILPADPGREEAFAIINAVGDQTIDFYDVMGQLGAALFDEADAVGGQLIDAFLGDVFGHRQNRSVFCAHFIIDVFEITLNACSDDA